MRLPNISSPQAKKLFQQFQRQTKNGTARGHRKATETHREGQHTLGLVTRHLHERICQTDKAESTKCSLFQENGKRKKSTNLRKDCGVSLGLFE